MRACPGPSPRSTTLVLGGARSGKSDWAAERAARSGRPVLYVATATAGDAEMAERIAVHRAGRPSSWRTVEEPLDLAGALRAHAGPGDLAVVDCLTLWTSNVVLARWPELADTAADAADADAVPPSRWRELETELLRALDSLLDDAAARDLALVLVSNEVGMGLVPPIPLGRGYRDALGRLNRAAAARADEVVLMVAGLAIDLRKLLVRPG